MTLVRARSLATLLAVFAVTISSASHAPAQTKSDVMKNEDVVKMFKAGFKDGFIITKINSSVCDFDTSADELIKLKGVGISVEVLTAMTDAPHPDSGPVAPPDAQAEPAPSGPSAEDLTKAAGDAFDAGNWDEAIADYTAAEKIDQSGNAAFRLGNVYLALGAYTEFASAWDRAISARQLVISVCHARGIQPCEMGRLLITRESMVYKVGGHTDFEQPLSSIAVEGVHEHKLAAYTEFVLMINGKKYNFIYNPFSAKCETAVHINCEAKGQAQQKAIAEYVAKLVSGATKAK